tara:strand:- start:8370 stop:9551 length:1182 start_codon:yes stop_codon:yes gene_type:complete
MFEFPISIRYLAVLSLLAGVVGLTSCSVTDLGKKDLTAVSGEPLKLRDLTDEETTGDLSVKDQFPDYNRTTASSSAHIFLIAGGAESPNYLQEIVDHRRLLIQSGHPASGISCFYVKPNPAEYEAHREQFDQLATEVEGFYLAAPHLIYRHMREAIKGEPEFVYLYAAGKGRKPIWVDQANGVERELAQHHTEYFGQYRIDLAGGPSGHMNSRMRLEALRDGIAIEHLLFTPRYLKQVLAEFPEETPKYVVLQADYSGGFVRSNFEELAEDTLTNVPNLAVLTATRHDRDSFRGTSGEVYSNFGEIFLDQLRKSDDSVANLNWRLIADEVAAEVRMREVGAAIAEEVASSPVYFSSWEEASFAEETATPRAVVEPVEAEEADSGSLVSATFEG